MGVFEALAGKYAFTHRHGAQICGGESNGFVLSATLQLLSPPIGKPVDSRQTITLSICPACRSVHELGGVCISRHRRPISFFTDFPATAMGNGNPLELHARTIQQLIAANLTLAAAWTWLEELCRNESGNVTSFPLVVTREIYTMGLDAMLMNILPNVTVENSGNSSVPQPAIHPVFPAFHNLIFEDRLPPRAG